MQMKLKEKVLSCIDQITKITTESSKKIDQINKERIWATEPYQTKLNEIEEKYRNRVLEEARKEKVIPISRYGSELPLDEIKANSVGLTLCWYDNVSGRTDYFGLTWEELEELEKENG